MLDITKVPAFWMRFRYSLSPRSEDTSDNWEHLSDTKIIIIIITIMSSVSKATWVTLIFCRPQKAFLVKWPVPLLIVLCVCRRTGQRKKVPLSAKLLWFVWNSWNANKMRLSKRSSLCEVHSMNALHHLCRCSDHHKLFSIVEVRVIFFLSILKCTFFKKCMSLFYSRTLVCVWCYV